ncbi:MAG: hypothetical protein DRP03_00400 [Candidatus Aenigmatarchaeota archaeon]|nr:MAG: hypothetical protein DRP03_00400 [Candidatus Aenigmarchaeota archaeon]
MTQILELTILSIVISFITMLIYRLMTDPKKMKEIKDNLSHYKKLFNKAQKSNDMEKAQKYMGEIMKLNQHILRINMRPMLISMIIVILAITYLGNVYKGITIALPFSLPFLGKEIGWFWWYVIVSFSSTLVIRNILGVE